MKKYVFEEYTPLSCKKVSNLQLSLFFRKSIKVTMKPVKPVFNVPKPKSFSVPESVNTSVSKKVKVVVTICMRTLL